MLELAGAPRHNRGVMLLEAVIPLPYFQSRLKEVMVGLLQGGTVSTHTASLSRDFVAVG